MSENVSDGSRDFPGNFWAPRDCFVPPIAEIDQAIEFLEQAADAILSGNLDSAASLVLKADIPELCEFAQKITGSTDLEIHRFREVAGVPKPTTARAKRRMPKKSVERGIFARDGWRCRFCGSRVVVSDALRRICMEVPDSAAWGNRGNADHDHCGFRAVCASLDHILPHSRGGDNDETNLVTACYPCQFGRNQF